MSTLIECKKLSKYYAGIRALDTLDLTISEKSVTGIVGPNGAGKTTLFSVLSGFIRPRSGSALLNGFPPGHSSLMGKIGVLPQDTPFIKGISVQSQMIFFARLQGFSKLEASKEMTRVLDLVNMSDISGQLPETLSFGQRKRVTFAQALIGNPEIIFLDEPTSGLDPVAASEIRDLIMSLKNQTMMMISSHNLDEIQDICEQIVMIDHGKVIEHCKISDLTEQNTCITLKLNLPLSNNVLDTLLSKRYIRHIDIEKNNAVVLTIFFNDESPENQMKILEFMQENNANVLEFSRGATLSNKIRDLANK